MTRISRKDTIFTENIENVSASFRAGIYTRLSKERTEEWRNKSCSIESQTEICQAYISKANMSLTKIYTDYEYSGTNFNRPGYQEMMEDVRNGIINCIVIRDLSRLGREHLEMGRLVDKVFPFLGVRFVSVVDKIDTENGVDGKLSFEMLIKNLINDLYAKDISTKVKSSKHTNAKAGYFIGSNPPFGYKVVEKDGGRKLVIDEKSSKIVCKIFKLFANGMNASNIAKKLNEQNISTSITYYKTGRLKREQGEPQWRKGTISNLLRKQVYIGHLIQGRKTSKDGSRSGDYRIKSEDEWIVVKNSHEPIVEEDIFYKVQAIMDLNKKNPIFKKIGKIKSDPINRYQNIIFDGNTGLALSRVPQRNNRRNSNHYEYRFTNNHYDGQILETAYITINEKDLDKMVVNKLENTLGIEANGKNTSKKIFEISDIRIATIDKNQKSLNCKIDKIISHLKISYEHYGLGKKDKDDYICEREELKKLLSIYESEINELEIEKVNIRKKAENEVNLLDKLFNGKNPKLTKELIEDYIERIEFYDSENFKINLKVHLGKGDNKYE